MRVAPDDAVFSINAVYLGPPGYTLPWAARYIAYVVFVAVFSAILLMEAIVPFVSIGIPPVWEMCLAVAATFGIMQSVDHDRPVASVWQTARVEAITAAHDLTCRPARQTSHHISTRVRGR